LNIFTYNYIYLCTHITYKKTIGSYRTRCHTAASSYNYGPEYLRRFHKKVTNHSPGKFTKSFISKNKKSNKQKELRKSFQTKYKT